MRGVSRSQAFRILKWLVREAIEMVGDSGWWQGLDGFYDLSILKLIASCDGCHA